MERSFFRQVKEAIASNAQATLERLGVNFKQSLKGEWTQVLCPFCGDKSGSASITKEGFLKCHQCSRKMDICEWYAEQRGIIPWEACKEIGGSLNLDMAVARHRGRPPARMTHDALRGSVDAFWESDNAKSCRTFLENRKLTDAILLERFGVGFLAGYLIFAQWTPTGHLRACYRGYTPGGTPPWMWKGGTAGGTLGFWPYFQIPKDGVIWILEGEFDVMTAWMRLRLQDQGIYCSTWTGGAGSPIKPHMIPEPWRGREIHIVPDNDVFQGPVLEEHRAPDEKKKLEMQLRWKNLMNNVAPSFLAQNCKVFLRSIPIDPLETWGGDFRDWVDRGGRDLADLKPHAFKDLRPAAEPPVEAEFSDVYRLAGKDVKFVAQVSTVDKAEIVAPTTIELQCDMNSMPYCANCKAITRFPGGMVHCEEWRDDVAQALMSRDWRAHMMKHVIGKPSACVHAKLVPQKYDPSARWTAVHDDMEQASERSLSIISKEAPSLTGEVEVIGRVHHADSGVMVMAEQIRELDRAQIDLGPYLQDLMQLCPTDTDRPELLDEYLARRCADLSFNVTKVHGRPDLHLVHDLLAHSTLWMTVDGLRKRGWLDIAVVGDTRTGKTETFRRLTEHHRLGAWQNCGQNISRAGLTMGGERVDGTYRVKPGLFPRNHKKMLVLDEFHHVVKTDIIKELQGARDDGRVFATKIFGSRMMPAAVRFATISNWPYDRERFRFLCEHLQAIYGTPECLSRTDFGLVVVDDPSESGLIETEHCWSADLVRALMLRAWAQDESMVHTDPKAITYAKQKCLSEWNGYYATQLPLFTPEEKHLTLLRMASAMSNLAFCHVPGEIYHSRVNCGHVEWAAGYLQKTWEWSEYESYSVVVERKKTLEQPFDVEAEIVVKLSLDKPEFAAMILPGFLKGITANEACASLGMEHHDTMKWLSKMQRLGALMASRDTNNGYLTEYRPTKAGDSLLRNMIFCAEEFPDEWVRRYRKMTDYCITRMDPQGLSPLTDPREKLRHEWDRD